MIKIYYNYLYYMTKIKKLFNMKENTKTELIGLLSILICLWLVFYFIPELFANLFHTILGKCIIFLLAIITSFYNVKYSIFLLIISIILYRFSLLKEGFEWSDQSTKDFILIQSTTNPNIVFDTNMIQKNQASQEEVDYFNKNGMWPWSDATKDLYMKAVNSNPYIKIAPDAALLEAQNIYNETSILMVLSYQTKEGQFLINGVEVPSYDGINLEETLPNGFGDFPYSSGLKPDLRDDVIRCNMETNNLERIHYSGKDGIYGIQNYSAEPVDYMNLENIIPGFLFTKCPCNPCIAMKMKPEYTCPFKLKVKDKPSLISSVWQQLWNVKNECTSNN